MEARTGGALYSRTSGKGNSATFTVASTADCSLESAWRGHARRRKRSASLTRLRVRAMCCILRRQADRGGVSFEMSRPLVYERRVQVDRQRVARLIARFALGIAVGAGLAFLLLRYL